MTPRELDAALAEKWCGWTKHRNGRPLSGDVDWDYNWVPGQFNNDAAYWRPLPHYSTTWEGFGLLMEEAERRGFVVIKFDQLDTKHRCLMVKDESTFAEGCGDSKQMAFALACAKACGIDVDNLVKEEKAE